MRPVKIQINLRIHAVWSESSMDAFWIARDAKFLFSCRQRKLWSDFADAQADLTLCWAHMSDVTERFIALRLIWLISFQLSKVFHAPNVDLSDCADAQSDQSMLGAHARRYIFSRCGSFDKRHSSVSQWRIYNYVRNHVCDSNWTWVRGIYRNLFLLVYALVH